MRTIGVVTVARSDYGHYLPILRQIKADPELQLQVLVSGMHLSPEFGLSLRAVEADGFEISEKIEMLLSSDTPQGIAKSMGLGIIGFAQAYERRSPDILLVLGDRFEMYAAALAALPFTIPIAHLHGGEVTEGAIDEAIRHSLTKLSHLHFVSLPLYRDRVIQMGEEPWRVVVTGAPSLDNLSEMRLLTREELEQRLEFPLQPSPLLVTFHPVTLQYRDTGRHVVELLAALEMVGLPVVFTHPNADTQGRSIMEAVAQFEQTHHNTHVVVNLGTQAYFSLMKHARAMVGNSSSGILEAASFELPVVNIGDRQRGRMHGTNVVDVPCERAAIAGAVLNVITPEFRAGLVGMRNPYGDGRAASRVVQILKEVPLDRNLIMKRFYDLPNVT
jgi:UDP-hydrolysing UDP-N-acetyl-D-glucosamine 2-epimerase